MLDILIKDILPIFVIMALGYMAGKRGVFSSSNAQIFNKLVLTYALPAVCLYPSSRPIVQCCLMMANCSSLVWSY